MLSQDLPIVIEVVDDAERIEAVLPEIHAVLQGGLVVTHEVRVHRRASPASQG